MSVEKVEEVYSHNIEELQKAFDYSHNNGIGSYRVSSDILPKFGKLKRENLFDPELYLEKLSKVNSHNLTLSFHPSQFVNMGSPHQNVIENSVNDIRDHIELSKRLGASEINIHLGGTYGDKSSAKERFVENMLKFFSRSELDLITVENDELNYSLEDTLEVANRLQIRMVYDIHHERCMRIGESFDEELLFLEVQKSWKNYKYQRVHISSPRDGYSTPSKSRPHSDYIRIEDFPDWLKKYKNLHIDIEAKAKECAIKELRDNLTEKKPNSF